MQLWRDIIYIQIKKIEWKFSESKTLEKAPAHMLVKEDNSQVP